MKGERHVLMTFPYPDDETFSSVETTASYIENGIPVTYVCLTLGQIGRNLGNSPFAIRGSLPYIREKELESTMKAIGITDLRRMGLRDKAVEFEPHEQMDDMVKTLIEGTNLSVVISSYPKFVVHPDHEATAETIVRTVGRMSKGEHPRLQLVAFSNGAPGVLGEPGILNSTSQYKGIKLEMFEAHKPRTSPFLERLTSPEADGETQSFLEVEPYWIYHFNN